MDPRSKVRYNERNGALVVDADTASVTFRLVDVSGKLVDVLVVRKRGG